MTTQHFHQIDEYVVGDDVYTVKCFAYPQHNEIDYEVYTCGGEYLFTVTSDRPDLSTSVLHRFIKNGDRTHLNYVSTDSED